MQPLTTRLHKRGYTSIMSDVKKVNADNWGRTSENYAQRVHKGPGMMMPLIARYTEASIIASTDWTDAAMKEPS